MKNRYHSLAAALLLTPVSAIADHHMEEMLVTAPLNKTSAETALPVGVLSGEELRRNAASTLGETLETQLGVGSASFGPGVGLPVIRGQSANRVRVLQDSVGTLDAAAVSPDHANSVEALVAKRIEVLRGPATLLYGNGAIGGVVNVIDNRIPEAAPASTSVAIEQRHNTVSDEDSSVFTVDGGDESWAWHIDGMYRDRNNVEIDGLANADPDAEDNSDGFIANSSARSKGLTAGASWIGERGFIGASVSRLENNYGLPPGVHEDHGAVHETEADIRLDMEQTRVDVKGAWQLDGHFNRLKLRLAHNDYEHSELEITDAATEVGTTYSNEGSEARLSAEHLAIGGFEGVVGLHLIDRNFAAVGEEAFIPASDISSAALFIVESIERGAMTYEFGLRGEQQRIAPESGCSREEFSSSASASALWQATAESNLMLSLSRSQRSPSIEESYSNIDSELCQPLAEDQMVEHAATGLTEVGNPELDQELSHNLELGWHKHAGSISGELNLFYNRIEDFIYLDIAADTGTGVERADYRQRDAVFKGYEAQLAWSANNALTLALFSDAVWASFENGGGNVPRISPQRYGLELRYARNDWSAALRNTRVRAQTDVAVDESITSAYTLLNAHLDYHLPLRSAELTLFAKADNLLNETPRNHVSFLKEAAPEAGRGVELGLRLQW